MIVTALNNIRKVVGFAWNAQMGNRMVGFTLLLAVHKHPLHLTDSLD